MTTESSRPAPTMPGAPVIPPPLPRESPRPPAITERIGTQSAGTPVPPSSPSAHPRRRARGGTGQRVRQKGGRRSSFRKIFVLLMLLTAFGWGRAIFTGGNNGQRRAISDASDTDDPDDVGTEVETAIASMLDKVGPNSASIQLARANIYWKRARKNHDPALVKEAEDTYHAVLRLNPDDDEAAEAREALRQIAEWKKAP
jgi:hypothetical protein